MKLFKLLSLLLVVTVAVFYSCSKDETQNEAQIDLLQIEASTNSEIIAEYNQLKKGNIKGNHVIVVLNVDTEKLNQENILECCYFSDSKNSKKPLNPENFKTSIQPNSIITFIANPINKHSESTIAITEIVFDAGVNLLGEQKIHGKSGKVSAEIVAGAAGDQEKYTVNFDVTRNGKTKSYSIDPVLQVNT